MGTRLAWSCLILAVAGLGPVVGFAWLNKLGTLAHSPQTVEMNVGSSTLVAGGRAKLWFSSIEMGPVVEVSCKSGSRLLDLTEEPSEEFCGIQVRALELQEREFGGGSVLRGKFEVTWKE